MRLHKAWLIASIVASVSSCAAHAVVTSSGNPALAGQTVIFTVQIDPPADITVPPTGSVTFLDNGMTIGTVPLENAVASFATKFATTGDHSVIAEYSGDENFQPADSPTFIEHVTADDLYTIAVTPSSLSQRSGASSVVTVSLFGNGSTASFSPVHLSCEGLPPGGTCSFGSSTVTPGIPTASTIVTISTTATRAGVNSGSSGRVYAATLCVPGLFGIVFGGSLVRRQRKAAVLAGGCVLAAMTLCLAGCSDSLKVIHSGTPAGVYNVRVVGNDGRLIQIAPVQLNVTN